MNRFLLFCFFIIVSSLITKVSAQSGDTLICYDESVPKISFKGKAPAPWAINGKVDDWKTILGPFTGRNFMPYYPPNSSGFNWSRDGKINREPNYAILPEYDSPTPDRDLIFNAFTNDDYNVYFYLRRLNNKNSINSFFYFCDVDADGFMGKGEPVFYGSFDSSGILSLSIGTFIPDTTLKGIPGNPYVTPYIPGKGNDMSYELQLYGFHMPGKVKELFNWKNIPFSFKLKRNETFSAAVTENGYGVEFAVPWRYFRNWNSQKTILTSKDVFAYRISLLKGNAGYDTANVADDANNCCGSLAVSDNPKITNQVSVTQLDSSLSYTFNLTYFNPINAIERVSIENVLLSNLSYTSTERPLLRDVKLNVASDSDCNGAFDNFTYGAYNEGRDWNANPVGADDTTTIGFEDSLYFNSGSEYGPAIHIPPHKKGCFVAHLTVPSQMSLINSNIEFNGSVRHWLHEIYDRCQDGGGGRTINPVGKSKTTIGGQSITSNVLISQLNKAMDDGQVKIYPNPNNGTATISLPLNEQHTDIDLYDMYGRTVKYWHQFNSNIITVNDLSSGMYFVKVIFKNGKTVIKRMIVDK